MKFLNEFSYTKNASQNINVGKVIYYGSKILQIKEMDFIPEIKKFIDENLNDFFSAKKIIDSFKMHHENWMKSIDLMASEENLCEIEEYLIFQSIFSKSDKYKNYLLISIADLFERYCLFLNDMVKSLSTNSMCFGMGLELKQWENLLQKLKFHFEFLNIAEKNPIKFSFFQQISKSNNTLNQLKYDLKLFIQRLFQSAHNFSFNCLDINLIPIMKEYWILLKMFLNENIIENLNFEVDSKNLLKETLKCLESKGNDLINDG